jgi:hypothetical protein
MEPATFAWLLAHGIRFEDHRPDERQLVQLALLRDERRQANRGFSRFTRLAKRIGLRPVGATAVPATCPCAA